MPLGQNPDFITIRDFFGGSNSFADYYRGGPHVPNIPANAAISTTSVGLAFSQFSGADKVSLPPAPSFNNVSVSDDWNTGGQGNAGAWITFTTNGRITTSSYNSGTNNANVWLPAGRSAGEYQIRVRASAAGSAWGAWQSLANNVQVVDAYAYTDGFYSDYQYREVYVQIGAQGTALSAERLMTAQASAIGRG